MWLLSITRALSWKQERKVLGTKAGSVEHWSGWRFNFFFKIFFNVNHFLKFFIQFVTIFLFKKKSCFFFFFFWPQGMWDLSSLTRNGTCTLCVGKWSLNDWPPGKDLERFLFFSPKGTNLKRERKGESRNSRGKGILKRKCNCTLICYEQYRQIHRI